jgi:hypothetical protein
MVKRIGVVVLCASIFFCGCGMVREVSMEEFKKDPHSSILGVRLKNGERIKFTSQSKMVPFYASGSIVGPDENGKLVGTLESKIDSVSYYSPDVAKTLLVLVGGGIVMGGVIWVLTTDFTLRWNGSK